MSNIHDVNENSPQYVRCVVNLQYIVIDEEKERWGSLHLYTHTHFQFLHTQFGSFIYIYTLLDGIHSIHFSFVVRTTFCSYLQEQNVNFFADVV